MAEAVAPSPAVPVVRPASARAAGGRRVRRYWPAIVGAALLVGVAVCAVAAPLLAPHDPMAQSLMLRLSPPLTSEGGRLYLLGTDQLGRDVLSRVVFGARVSLAIGVGAVAGSAVIGIVSGLLAGFLGGAVDALVMRLVELRLAFPIVLLALVVVAYLGPTAGNILLVFTLTSWPIYARTIRTSVQAIRHVDYVVAARAVGGSDRRVLWRHIFPNVINPCVVLVSFELARIVVLEASLGFLGLGVQPPVPTWGNMLAEGRDYLEQGWWVATFPGLAILVTVGSINFVGDAVRDRLDPRLINT
jgi:peptide/nickel transport system permease protein